MKKLFVIMMVAVALTGCSSEEKQAGQILVRAEASLNNGDYNMAKMQIDSIKMTYPKAFKTRKAGIRLMQKIDLAEQNKTLQYLDSMMQVKVKALDAIKKNFVLEKDTAYQEVGNYFYPTQTVERNINRSFLRAQVSELGEMSLTSIYRGRSYMHHEAVKVSVGDNFAVTPSSSDRYESTDLGRVTEKADYKVGQDGGVLSFIMANKDKRIHLEYIGKRKYSTYMQTNDIKAVVKLAELAKVLTGIQQIKKEQGEANLKIRFVTRKMKESEMADRKGMED